jgi:large subunit ribosomal protein L4
MPKKKIVEKIKDSKIHELEAEVYNLHGEVVGKTELPREIFAAKVNPQLIAQAVRIFLANQRSGTASVKTRSEVTGSTRKIYRQKGTGRARHGDIKAPIFIGGGIAHGPKPRDYSLKIPVKMRQAAFLGAMSDKFDFGAIKIVSGFENIKPKTKEMVAALRNLQLIDKKNINKTKILLILPEKTENVYLSGRNIPYLSIKPVYTVNTYDMLVHKNIVFMQDAVKKLSDIYLNTEKSQDIKIQKARTTNIPVKTRKKKRPEIKRKDKLDKSKEKDKKVAKEDKKTIRKKTVRIRKKKS